MPCLLAQNLHCFPSLVMEVQIPYLSIQGPFGYSPTFHLLLTPACTYVSVQTKKGQFYEYLLQVSTFMSLFLLSIHHDVKMNSCPSFQTQPEYLLLHEAQAQMLAPFLDSTDETHFNGSSSHVLPPLTAISANTYLLKQSEHSCGLCNPPVTEAQ